MEGSGVDFLLFFFLLFNPKNRVTENFFGKALLFFASSHMKAPIPSKKSTDDIINIVHLLYTVNTPTGGKDQ